MASIGIQFLFIFSIFCFAPITFGDEQPQRHLVGGFEPIENGANNPSLQEIEKFAEVELNKLHNNMYLYRIVDVMEADRKVVAGVIYRLKLRMKRTSCKNKKETLTSGGLQGCTVKEDNDTKQPSPSMICKVEIVHQAWRNQMSLHNQSCFDSA